MDHWWQTETGFPICANFMGYDGPFDAKLGSSTFPVPGWDVRVLPAADDEAGDDVVMTNLAELPRGELGNLVVKPPLPPCAGRRRCTRLGGSTPWIRSRQLRRWNCVRNV